MIDNEVSNDNAVVFFGFMLSASHLERDPYG
jgi:hypothetical protein